MPPSELTDLIKNFTGSSSIQEEENEEDRRRIEYYKNYISDDDDDEPEVDWQAQIQQAQINITTIMMERLEKERVELFKEGVSYAGELAFFVWIMISISLCSGMYVENPV